MRAPHMRAWRRVGVVVAVRRGGGLVVVVRINFRGQI
jgi:hypothetical protein